MAADPDASPPYGDQPTQTMRWIGQYQVIREIGHGAEGIVYQARDPAIGRDVAIKELRLSRLPPDEIPEARQRFVREAQAVGNLRHENIVTLYQFIEQPDALYLVMEFIPGGALRPKLIGTTSEAVAIVRQVAAALDHAHANGIVHRDIKPGNILVSGDPANHRPVMKVADFGIARFLTRTMTVTGVSMGTPAYMAPEQIQGYRVDARADQFSLAVLACELLSGRLPFTAPNYQALTFQIVNAEPASLREANPWLPPELDRVIRRALAKNPDERFPSCGAFGDALEQVLAPTGPATQRTVPVTSRGHKKYFAIAAGALLAVAVAAVTLYFRQPTPTSRAEPASAVSVTPARPTNPPVEKQPNRPRPKRLLRNRRRPYLYPATRRRQSRSQASIAQKPKPQPRSWYAATRTSRRSKFRWLRSMMKYSPGCRRGSNGTTFARRT